MQRQRNVKVADTQTRGEFSSAKKRILSATRQTYGNAMRLSNRTKFRHEILLNEVLIRYKPDNDTLTIRGRLAYAKGLRACKWCIIASVNNSSRRCNAETQWFDGMLKYV